MTLTLVKPTTLNTPTITKLPNGLTIIAEQMPVDAVNLNVWFNVGSTVESDCINGMAHFLEHMIFKGTPRLESGEFERLIEERGQSPMPLPVKNTLIFILLVHRRILPI